MNLASTRQHAEKAVRTALFFAPWLYRAVSSELRYVTLYRLGLGHEREFRLVAPFLPPAPTVVDVGGNLGQSVLSVMACMPDANVISFEPNARPRASLLRVAARFPGQVRVVDVGLGDREASRRLYVPTYRGKEMPGLASFDELEAAGWISERTVHFFDPSLLRLDSFPVTTRRLDDFGLDPDLVKIDVQGFEHEVVMGGLQTIERSRPVIIAEAPTPPLVHLLAELEYSVVERKGRALQPSMGAQANQVFLPARPTSRP